VIKPKNYQLKATLVGVKPPIWWEFVVLADYSFFALHVALQDALGWHDSHLHQFFTDNPFNRDSTYERIGFPTILEVEDMLDERKERLSGWLRKPNDKVWYEYDLGDSWMHEIVLKEIHPPIPSYSSVKPPILFGGKRACPPEDCGGIGGYADVLVVLANPRHERHQDMLTWLDIETVREFDPEAFDVSEVEFHNPKQRIKEYEKGFRL